MESLVVASLSAASRDALILMKSESGCDLSKTLERGFSNWEPTASTPSFNLALHHLLESVILSPTPSNEETFYISVASYVTRN